MIGQVIGNYRIVSELGRGGMGMVYRAEHVQLGRPAALKMLQPQMSSQASIVQRFFNEARAASSIDHPGIVEIYDFGTHTDGRAYIVMALLRGESLEARLERGPLAPLEGATLMAQVASALAAAHARGIVHRDLKPDNIFLVPNEMMPGGVQIKLLDFGIAKLADEQQAGFKTQTGALIGTPAYMSPEQCMGRSDLDHRTDIYSFGCILFHILCGRPPFLGEQGTGMMIAAHLRDAPPDPRSLVPNISAPVAAIMLRCLEKDPGARFQSAVELKNALIQAGAQGTMSRVPDTTPGSYAATMATPISVRPGEQAAYAATMGTNTTQSGSAAQLVAQPKKSNPLVWAGAGIALSAVVAVGVWLVMRNPSDATEKRDEIAAQHAGPTSGAQTPSSGGQTASSGGQTASSGAQTPSSATQTPSTASTAQTPNHPSMPTSLPPPQKVSAEPLQLAQGKGPSFKLDKQAYAPGATINIAFASAISSSAKSRAWVTVVEAQKPPTQYGDWVYVNDGAKSAALKAPEAAGTYEVRLHTEYPAKSANVVYKAPLTVVGGAAAKPTPLSQQRFTLATTTLKRGDSAQLSFAAPMRAVKGEKFWVTVVKAGVADNTWGHYDYVPDDATTMKVAVPDAAGDYEVRLHANYPTKTTNVVYRMKIQVQTD